MGKVPCKKIYRFIVSFLLLALLVFSGAASFYSFENSALANEALEAGVSDAALEVERERFYATVNNELGELETVYIENDPERHRTVEYEEPSTSLIQATAAQAVTYPGPFNVNDTRPFYMSSSNYGSSGTYPVKGNLVAQGRNANIWILDDTDFHRAYPSKAHNASCKLRDLTAALASEIATAFDGIYDRMTNTTTGFATFKNVRVTMPYSNVSVEGDLAGDGKVNILLHDLNGPAGFFTNGDYFTDGSRLAMIHVDFGTYGYGQFTGAAEDKLDIYGTMAHEFQHLLFDLYFGAYSNYFSDTVWFNEMMSEVAKSYYTQSGVEVTGHFYSSVVNTYNGSGARDFLSWGGGGKNYGMISTGSKIMYKKYANFATKVYNHFKSTYPVATSTTAYNNNKSKITSMKQSIGDAIKAATGLGTGGANSLETFYFLFMENFGADGGDVSGTKATKILNSTKCPDNLWAIRPVMGRSDGWLYTELGSGRGWVGSSYISEKIPDLASGGAISLSGYGSTPSAGASHEKLYKLTGSSSDPSAKITITAPNDGKAGTRYYAAIPKDPLIKEGSSYYSSGAQGASLTPLTKGSAQVLNTSGRDVYLYVVTFYQTVSVSSGFSYSFTDTRPKINSVTISGNVAVSSTLTATISYSATIASPAITYQWQYSTNGTSWTNISGATASTYAIPSAQGGRYLRVTVTSSDTNVQAGSMSSAATVAVDARPTITSVYIASSVGVNKTLTASVTLSSTVSSPGLTYQWQFSSNGTSWSNISGATAQTYTITPAQSGGYIRVTVTSSNTNVQAGSMTSASTTVITDGRPQLSTVSITGTPAVGMVLTAAVKYSATITGPEISYIWQISDGGSYSNISGATASTYTVAVSDAGKTIRVQVTSNNTNVQSGVIYSAGYTVTRISPTAPTVANITYSPDLWLSSITLSAGWSWKTDVLLTAGAKTYEAQHSGDNTYLPATAQISFTVLKADINPTSPVITDITYFSGIILSNVTLPAGWEWSAPATSLSAGNKTYSAVYTHSDSANYNNVTRNLSFTVLKADPNPSTPVITDITYFSGITLNSVTLPAQWTWAAPQTSLTAGNKTYSAVYNPTDTANFNYLTRSLSFTVLRANPDPSTPVITDITYFNSITLNSVSLPSGWAWLSPATALIAGSKTYAAEYTPSDAVNYYNITRNLSFTVLKADSNPSTPVIADITYFAGLILDNISLPTGWTWLSPETALTAGSKTYAAEYTPFDTVNYNNITRNLTFAVLKANINPDTPSVTDITYFSGIILSNIDLPSDWSWSAPETALTAGSKTYAAVYTPSDAANYNEVIRNISFVILKANPNPASPVIDEIQYFIGITLNDIVLSQGWAWLSPETAPLTGSNAFMAEFTPQDSVNYYSITRNIYFVILKADFQPDLPVLADIKYYVGITLSKVTLPQGWSWQNPQTALNAGYRTYVAIYTPDDENFNESSFNLSFTVIKGDPDIILPVINGTVYFEGIILSDIELPYGWEWTEQNTSLFAGARTFTAIYTPDDTDNLNTATREISFIILKAESAPEAPVINDLTYFENIRLSNITLPSGWAWQTPSASLSAGSKSYTAIFTPSDTENYNPKIISLAFVILKADPSISVFPSVADFTYFDGELSSIALAGGWSWEESGTLISAGAKTYTAVYVPSDLKNYNICYYSVSFTVFKASPQIPQIGNIVFYEGLKLDSISLGSGWVWNVSELPLEAGTYTIYATYIPNTQNYNSVSYEFTFTIEKAEPAPPVFAKLIKHSDSLSLSSIELPEGWVWADPDTVITKGKNSHKAVYVGDNNYISKIEYIDFETSNIMQIFLITVIVAGSVIFVAVTVLIIVILVKKKSHGGRVTYRAEKAPRYKKPKKAKKIKESITYISSAPSQQNMPVIYSNPNDQYPVVTAPQAVQVYDEYARQQANHQEYLRQQAAYEEYVRQQAAYQAHIKQVEAYNLQVQQMEAHNRQVHQEALMRERQRQYMFNAYTQKLRGQNKKKR